MPQNHDIYIILSDTGTWFSKLIRVFTGEPLNHASIALEPDQGEAYSFGRKNLSHPFEGGLVKESFRDVFYSKAECAVYRFRASRGQYERIRSRINTMMAAQERYKYHFWGLFGVLLGRKIVRQDAFFCSQFVAALFEEAGHPLVGKPSYLTAPGDFAKSPYLETVFSGNMHDYYRPYPSPCKNPQGKLPCGWALRPDYNGNSCSMSGTWLTSTTGQPG